jgi:hypothetical protein
MVLRWYFEGFQGFLLFSSNLCCPATHRVSPRFCILHCSWCPDRYCRSQKVTPLLRRSYRPPAAPEPAIQSASQPGTNFPDEPKLGSPPVSPPNPTLLLTALVWPLFKRIAFSKESPPACCRPPLPDTLSLFVFCILFSPLLLSVTLAGPCQVPDIPW